MIIYWFRNDIRLHDNPALFQALKQSQRDKSPLVTVFINTPEQWRKHHRSKRQIDFLHRHINATKSELENYHIPLLWLEADDFKQQTAMVFKLAQQLHCHDLFINEELEVNETQRDKELELLLAAQGTKLHSSESDVIVPKGSLLNQQGQMYRVFTPFKKAWLKYADRHPIELKDCQPLLTQYAAEFCKSKRFKDSMLPELTQFQYQTSALTQSWPIYNSQQSAQNIDFFASGIFHYDDKRDFPAQNATSNLSPYLAIGALSSRALFQGLPQYKDILPASERASIDTWRNQLIWRDFYRHLLFHFPTLSKGACFQEKYQSLPWPNSNKLFDAWCNGKTGYPLVDAAMMQLKTTGWMHNRLRMIVASFLTKHLLVDWRLGEKYFSQQLIDIDLANNNGGWQWAASTGCDAQPYFRIFNPITQSKKFDPNGEFIRIYLPMLNQVPDNKVHFPHEYMEENKLEGYWPAVVEHKQARENALAFYQI